MKFVFAQWLWTLAQAAGPVSKPDGPAPAAGPNMTMVIPGILLALVLFIWISGRGRKKEQHTREKMLAELARNDKVVTIGGLVGTITDVKDDEVTIKVDESTNTKVRMKKWAVRMLESGEQAGQGGPANKT